MKNSTILSTWSVILTILASAIIIYAAYLNLDNWKLFLILGVYIGLLVATLFYMPLSISANEKEVNVNRSLRIKSIPMSEISSVQLCPPTMAELRLCGSGGWFGYWGHFKEPSIGKYFAYYGKASDCFLLVLKNGKKYMLGCKNPQSMVSYIQAHLHN